ncbi:MAG: ferredoxin family protein [Sedimentisphaerales bacterium]|nr:ferredoxin family protein [Sedimentisphaerales bacterium]
MAEKTLTIYCDCAYYELVEPEVKSKVFDAIKAAGVEFEATADLCRLCAEGDPRLKEWAKADSLRIIACYPRAVKWLFHRGGVSLDDKRVEFINMRTGNVREILSSLHGEPSSRVAAGEVQMDKKGDWIPWFPVIDYDRCRNCKQCYGFCLFGVYQLDEDGRVEVRNPASCKTNCPACAKACPASAIIFPKYGEVPVNGAEPQESSFEEEAKAELGDLLSGDIYETIRKRGNGKRRFSADAKGAGESLKDLREKLAIPSDVLASLSPAEIAGIRKKAGKKSGGMGGSKDDE